VVTVKTPKGTFKHAMAKFAPYPMLKTSCNFHTFFGGCQYVHAGDKFEIMFFIEFMSSFLICFI